MINEINFNTVNDFETEDWVELYNNGDTAVDISNWVFKDSDDAHEYVIPEGTIMQPDTYLVLVQTLTEFQMFHATLRPVLGDFEFGLSGGGELIRLFDDVGTLIDFVEYDDADPWPVEADGNGPTLELINPDFDNSLGASWQACTVEGSEYGSPGAANSECTLGLVEFNMNNTSVYVFPNPMTTETTILLSSSIPSFNFTVYDILGREVFQKKVNSNKYVFKKNSLNSGTYFLNIKISKD